MHVFALGMSFVSYFATFLIFSCGMNSVLNWILHSATNLNCILQWTRTIFGERALSVSGFIVWNSLSLCVRSSQTLTGFKRNLKSQFFKLCFWLILNIFRFPQSLSLFFLWLIFSVYHVQNLTMSWVASVCYCKLTVRYSATWRGKSWPFCLRLFLWISII